MLLWTLFTACTQDPPPAAGRLEFCFSDELAPTMSTEEPRSIIGQLLDVRTGEENNTSCSVELVIVDETQTEHIIGYSVFDPEGNEATLEGQFVPRWSAADNVSLIVYSKMGFGMESGIILEDDDGLMVALEGGSWGGALSEVDLPFVVEHSENDIGSLEEDCLTTTGYTFKIGEEYMAPFGEFDIDLENQAYTFGAIAALEFGPGRNCETSDMSDRFSWMLLRQ